MNTQQLVSDYRPLCSVVLPDFKGRQLYMHEVDAASPRMLDGYEDYNEVVSSLLASAGYTSGPAFVTVDEKVIQPGMSQRRPGPHVDGHFIKSKQRWGHDGWNHFCNEVPIDRMPIIVAASVPGCRAWRGTFDATPRDDGDLSHVELGEGELLPSNVGYLLSPDCIHESLRFEQETQRAFLRIALPPSHQFSGGQVLT